MTYTVEIIDRLSDDVVPSGGLKFKPLIYSNRAVGGPKKATIEASGNEIALWQGLNNIGCGLRLYSEYGDQVWWGYIHEAKLTVGIFDIRVNLDNVANKVKVSYSYIVPDSDTAGERKVTSYLYDQDSIRRYGVKEVVYSTGDASDEIALALRDTLLAEMKQPLPEVIQIGNAERETKLTYTCRGWWNTLDWRYYENKYTEHGYTDNGSGALEFGYNGSNVQKVGQSFQLPTAMTIRSAKVGLAKTGNPTDNLTAYLFTDSANAPGSLLATSATIAGTLIKADFQDVQFKFATPYAAGSATTYWLTVARSGAMSGTDYYKADTNWDCGYTSGEFKYYNGTSWGTLSTQAADMMFMVSSEEVGLAVDTATQVKSIIEYRTGNVAINTAEIINASGINTSPYREGDNTALFEIEELLKLGTTNNRRLLAKVLSNKKVQIFEEPANTSTGYISLKGELFDSYGGKMRKETCPVGLWVDLRSVAPAGASFGVVGGQTSMFIEESEYDVERDILYIEPREHVGTFDFLRVRNA